MSLSVRTDRYDTANLSGDACQHRRHQSGPSGSRDGGLLFAASIVAILLAGAFGIAVCIRRLPREMRTAASLQQIVASAPFRAQGQWPEPRATNSKPERHYHRPLAISAASSRSPQEPH